MSVSPVSAKISSRSPESSPLAAIPTVAETAAAGAVRESGISSALKRISPDDLHAECLPKGTGRATSYLIRQVAGAEEMETVYRLAHDAYLDYGYIASQPDGKLCAAPHLDRSPLTEIWVMTKAGKIIATATLTMDSSAGLIMDPEFPDELKRVRSENARLACVWRLAVDREHRNINRVVLQLISHMVHRMLARCDTALFVVNPRHSGYYRRLLNMLTLAACQTMHGLKNAPADLLRWDAVRCPVRFKMDLAGSVG